MMKLSLVCAAAALCALVSSAPAEAQQIQIKPQTVKLLSARVQGKVNVTVPQQLAGLSCANIKVTASSVEMQPAPQGGFSAGPKWTRSAQASGGSLSACNYSIDVPPNQAFHLAISSASTTQCQAVNGQPTPNAYVQVTAPPAGTKVFDFSAQMLCQKIH